MSQIQLLCGDCIQLMSQIPDKSIDLVCTDLPFGQTKNEWDTVIPFNDYVFWEDKRQKRIMYLDDFLLCSYKTGRFSYKEALEYFNGHKHPGIWTHYRRILKENGAAVLFSNGIFTADLMQSCRDMWKYNLIWEKTQPTGFQNARRMPLRNHEEMCVFYRKQPTYNPQKTGGHIRRSSKAEQQTNRQSANYGKIKAHTYDSTERFPKSVWLFAKDTRKCALTPTQKPLALLEEIIKTYTNEGGTVLDSCMGSNTCGRACKNLNRNYIGIEEDPDTFLIAQKRTES